VLSEAVAIKLLENKSVLDEHAAKVRSERDRLVEALQGMTGLVQFPTAANFVLVRIEGGAGAGTRVFDGMKRAGVLVKNFSGGHPMLENCLRLTVGTPEENQAMLAALRHALS
jgi:histidinol-phosphate aminotransferase